MVEQLAGRPFAFYPPIHNLEHNEWQLRKATWSELVAVERRTGQELTVPRRFVAEVSDTGDAFVIVGLARELEFRDGAVWPHRRRVIEMPMAVGVNPGPAPVTVRSSPAPVVAISLESPRDSRYVKVVGAGLLLALAACLHVTALNLMHTGVGRQRATLVSDHSYLDLNGADRYQDVVAKLGEPAADQWTPASAGLRYRALSYPVRHFTAILLGTERDSAAYIGSMDSAGRVIHSVPLAAGGTTYPLLRNFR